MAFVTCPHCQYTFRVAAARVVWEAAKHLVGAAPLPCQVAAFGTFLEPWQVRGPDPMSFRGLREWRRGESNPRPKVHPRAHLRA